MSDRSRDGSLENELARLAGLATSLVGPSDAPDVVQDTWIAARRAGPKQSLGPWLRGVVRNQARLRRRASGRRARREADHAIGQPAPAPPDERLAEAEVWDAIRQELRRLPEDERGLVEARFLNERTPAQIAAAQGVPVGTVRSRISRALARMRGQLAERHQIKRGHIAVALGIADRPASGSAPASLGLGASVVTQACVVAAVGGLMSIWWLSVGPGQHTSGSVASSAAPDVAAVNVAGVEPYPPEVGLRPSRRPSRAEVTRAEPRQTPLGKAIDSDESPSGPKPAALLLDVADVLPDLIAEWDDDLYGSLFEPRDAEGMRRSFQWYREQLGDCGPPEHVGGSGASAEFVYQCETGMLDAVLGADDSDARVKRVRTGARGVPAPERVAAAARAAVGLHNAWDDEVFETRFSERYRDKADGRTAAFLEDSRRELGPCELGEVKAASIRTALYGLDCEHGHRTLSIGVNRDDKIFKFRVLQPRTFDGS
ncbi:MAG: RNA polymerase sigma factor [Myxococcota bacterium]